MRKCSFWFRYVAMFAFAALTVFAQTAQAQATRTWVSGVGDDVNPCSRTAPCKTFAGAISKTATGGEINAIDPGGYGAVTITKSITIDGGGTFASILNSGTIGILVNGAATDVVHLRNLSIDGAGGTPGTHGIRVLQAGTVMLQNLQIFGMSQNAVDIVATAGAGALNVSLDNVNIQNITGSGVSVNGAARIVNATLSGVQIQKSATGVSALAGSTVDISRSNINFSTIAAISASTATSIVRLSDTTLAANAACLSATGSGQIISFNNNRFLGNPNNVVTDCVPTSTVYQR